MPPAVYGNSITTMIADQKVPAGMYRLMMRNTARRVVEIFDYPSLTQAVMHGQVYFEPFGFVYYILDDHGGTVFYSGEDRTVIPAENRSVIDPLRPLIKAALDSLFNN